MEEVVPLPGVKIANDITNFHHGQRLTSNVCQLTERVRMKRHVQFFRILRYPM